MINVNTTPMIVSINLSGGGIPKLPVASVRIKRAGLEGDGHHHAKHYRPEQAVSLQDVEELAALQRSGYMLDCGTTGENLNVSGLRVNALSIGSILYFSGGVKLEITKVRTPCYVLDAIHPKLKEDILGKCGMYARVLEEGVVNIGETIHLIKPSN